MLTPADTQMNTAKRTPWTLHEGQKTNCGVIIMPIIIIRLDIPKINNKKSQIVGVLPTIWDYLRTFVFKLYRYGIIL